jgi:RNA polymerase sigma factor (sigma-70 family)
MIGDSELLHRYAHEASEAAFAELVQRHIGLVYHAALRQLGGDGHRAHDVTQTVFTDLARKAAVLARHPALPSWLHTSTRYAAATVRRAERTRKKYEEAAETMKELERDETPAEWTQLRPLVDELLQQLNESDRTVLLLRFFEGRPFAEIGTALNLSEDAARMRVERGLEKLHRLLARRGLASSTMVLGLMLTQQAVGAAPVGLAAIVTGQALASASAAGPALSLFQFMSASKITTGAVSLAFLLAAGTGIYETWARRTADDALRQATRQRDERVATLQRLEQSARAAADETAKLAVEIETARPASAAAKPTVAPVNERTAQGNAFLAQHPEVKTALDRYARARTEFEYGPLFQKLHLTAAQVDEISSLLPRGMGASAPDGKEITLRSGQDLSSAERNSRLHEILGEDGFQQYVKFSKNELARVATNKVAGSLYFTDTPLLPTQADELTAIIQTSPAKAGATAGTRYDWDTIISRASSMLSPAQVAVLEDLRAQDRFMVALNTPAPAGPYSKPANPAAK